jgi:PilZ domain
MQLVAEAHLGNARLLTLIGILPVAVDFHQRIEHRAGERVPFTEHLRIRMPTVQHATGVDIGAKGICVLVQQTIPIGSVIELELFDGTAFVRGTVLRVAPAVRGFRTAIEFQTEQPAVLAKAKALQR